MHFLLHQNLTSALHLLSGSTCVPQKSGVSLRLDAPLSKALPSLLGHLTGDQAPSAGNHPGSLFSLSHRMIYWDSVILRKREFTHPRNKGPDPVSSPPALPGALLPALASWRTRWTAEQASGGGHPISSLPHSLDLPHLPCVPAPRCPALLKESPKLLRRLCFIGIHSLTCFPCVNSISMQTLPLKGSGSTERK